MGRCTLTDAQVKSFWDKIDVRGELECWPWKYSTNGVGYGKLKIVGRFWLAHRLAYVITFGDPGSRLLCHTCDHRWCCNPRYVFVGTHKDNTADCIKKGRFAKGRDAGGALLTETQVRTIRALYVPKKFGRYKIARLLGVKPSTVDSVIQGNWEWLK